MKKKYAVAAIILVACFLFAFLLQKTYWVSYAESGIGITKENEKTSFGGSQTNDLVYRIEDNLFDSEEFETFRKEPENINKIVDFYNGLADDGAFATVTVFDQALAVKDFKGDNQFHYNSEEFIEEFPELDINIKSMQMNQEAFEFLQSFKGFN